MMNLLHHVLMLYSMMIAVAVMIVAERLPSVVLQFPREALWQVTPYLLRSAARDYAASRLRTST